VNEEQLNALVEYVNSLSQPLAGAQGALSFAPKPQYPKE
jgi:hypothetical protein